MKSLETDVLVIGSGFGAAAPALRMAQKGFRVLMIEKGKALVPERDFRMTQDPRYLRRFLKGISSPRLDFTYAEALGGASGFYEMVSLRAPSAAFNQVDQSGRRLWPEGLSRATMDPFYEIAEQMLGVEQIAPGEVPRTGIVFSRLMANLGYSCDRARYAVRGCVGSGYCISGCVFGAKQSLDRNYLPQATAAGMDLRTEVEALVVQPVGNTATPRARTSLAAHPVRYVVRCREIVSGEMIHIRAKLVILGGGTVGTARLLRRSRNELKRLSGHVGRNIAINGNVSAGALLPDAFIDGDMLNGRTHPGMICYDFLDSLGITISAVKPMPLNLVSSARIALSGGERSFPYWGRENVDLMKRYRRRMIILYALGMTPPTARIEITGSGVCTPRLDVDERLRSYYEKVASLLKSILERNGCRLIEARSIDHEGRMHKDLFFSTAHMTGSCRMADTNTDGVIDVHGEVFDHPGLYVTDGAALPTSLAVNTSLTIIANAERIASHLLERYAP
jgi:enediyne biosynthesis protein E9